MSKTFSCFILHSLILLLLVGAVDSLSANPAGRFLMASYFRQSRHEKVLETIKTIKNPDEKVFLYKGKSLQALERFDEAVEVYKKILTDYADTSEATKSRELILRVFEETRDYDGLAGQLQRFIDDAKDAPVAARYRARLAYVYLKNGKSEDGIALLVENHDYRGLSEYLVEAGQYNGYLNHLTEQKDYSSLRTLGELLFISGEYKKSLPVFQKLAEMSSDRLEDGVCVASIEKLVLCYEHLSEYRSLVRTLPSLIALEPDNLLWYQKLGTAWYRTGSYEKAMASWRKLVSFEPKKVENWLSLASILEDHGLYAQKLDVLFEGKAVTNVELPFLVEIFPAALAVQDYDKAVETIVKVVSLKAEKAREMIDPVLKTQKKFRAKLISTVGGYVEKYPSIIEYYLFYDYIFDYENNSTGTILSKALVRAWPDYDSLFFQVIHELHARKRHGLVLRVLTDVLPSLETDKLDASLLIMAQCQMALGSYEKALALVNRILESGRTATMSYRRALKVKGEVLTDKLYRNEEAMVFWETACNNTAAPGLKALYGIYAAKSAISLLKSDDASRLLQSVSGFVPSGLKSEFSFSMGMLCLISGDLEKGKLFLTESVATGRNTVAGAEALRLLLFLTDYAPDKTMPGDDRAILEQKIVTFFKLRIALDAHNFKEYDVLAKTVRPDDIPSALADEFLLLQADRANARGDTEQELDALLRLCRDNEKSPHKDRVLFRIATHYFDTLKDWEKASAVLSEHLLSFPNSLRVEDVRIMLRKAEERKQQK